MKNIKPIFWILILAAILRLINLNQSLWLDEAIQWWASTSFSVRQLLTQYSIGDFNPPLFYVITHYWIKLFGDSEISLRFPSVIFGVATVYLVYKISQLILPKRNYKLYATSYTLPDLAALLAATSGLLIYYSQEARVYSLAALTTTGAIYYLLKLKKSNHPPSAISYLLFAISMLYSHYLTWLLIPVFLFAQPLLTSIALISLVPWLPIFLKQLSQGANVISVNPVWGNVLGGLTFKNTALIPIKFLFGRIPVEANLFYAVVIGIPLALVTYLLFKSLPKKPFAIRHLLAQASSPFAAIWLWLLIPLLLGAIISTKIPIFSYFRFLFVVPAFYILLTIGASKLKSSHRSKALAFLVLLNLLASSYYLLASSNHRENWKAAAAYIHKTNPQAPVFIRSAVKSPFEYYDRGTSSQFSEKNIQEAVVYPEIWYIPYAQPIFDPEQNTINTLKEFGFVEKETKHFRGVTVQRLQNPTYRHLSQSLTN